MRLRIALSALTLIVLTAPAALATPAVDEVADEVSVTGLYVEPGLSADRSALDASINRAGNTGVRLMVVLLDADPAGGAVTFADAVLDRVPDGTVLVLSASSEGMASTEFDEASLDGALEEGFLASSRAPSGQGDEAFVSAVVDVLTGTTTATTAAPGSGAPGGGSGLWIFLIIVGGLVLLVVWAVKRGNKSAAAGRARVIEEARAEISSQLAYMANKIIEITDLVSASSDRQDDTYLRQASATYSAADTALAAASDLKALEELSMTINEARWQLDAAAAIVAGEPVPPQPPKEERYACFFDPNHPNATETAEIKTAAGSQTVRVCREDAEKLRRGQQPQPRMIDVGGRRVPAPMAPRSYGGGGFDWLDVFTVITGGVGQGAAYDWGRSRPTVRSRSTWSTGGGSRRSTTRSSGSSSRSSSGGSRSRSGNTRSRNR
ncbi:MAG: hypothetical protein QY307_05950 [Acidimicrobiia bacterium]|nr:MAG: hypothetical protein QY307_05950 [Acidimicrobiia bacterium]